MTFLKNNWSYLLNIVFAGVISYLLFKTFQRPSSDQSEIKQLQVDLKPLQRSIDSLLRIANEPLPEEKTDSLVQVNIAINNKTLNELRQKNNSRIDTIGRDELRRIFAELPR